MAEEPMVFETEFREVIPRTHDTKSFRFDVPRGFMYSAGQWMFITIRIGGKEKQKHFTISSSPTDPFLEFTKKIRDTEFSQALDKVKPGDWVKIDGPYGEFIYDPGVKKFGFLTGGIGITPMHSIMKYCVDTNKPVDIVMLYANKTRDDIVFKEDLESFGKTNSGIVVKNVLTRDESWQGLKGHVDAKMIQSQIPDYYERTFYICGPPGMNQAMIKVLKELKVPDGHIRLEDFSGYD
jgi:ferredoxin-NADP reductase